MRRWRVDNARYRFRTAEPGCSHKQERILFVTVSRHERVPHCFFTTGRLTFRLGVILREDNGKRSFLPMTITHKNSLYSGYTLVELIIAIGLFSIIMTLSSGAYLMMIGLNRQAQGIATGINDLSFAIETMTRDIRTGSLYSCGIGLGLGDCPLGSSSFSFKNKDSLTVSYGLSGSSLQKTINATQEVLTDSSVTISSFTVYVSGTAPAPSDYQQPPRYDCHIRHRLIWRREDAILHGPNWSDDARHRHMSMNRFTVKNNKGFTLVESMIAVTILTFAVAGPLYTASRALVAAEIARDKLTASYLAQEGVEYVRAMRDNEYLTAYQAGGGAISSTAWNNFLNGSNAASITKCRAMTCTLDTYPTVIMGTGSGLSLQTCSGSSCTPLYLANGIYTQQSTLTGAVRTSLRAPSKRKQMARGKWGKFWKPIEMYRWWDRSIILNRTTMLEITSGAECANCHKTITRIVND